LAELTELKVLKNPCLHQLPFQQTERYAQTVLVDLLDLNESSLALALLSATGARSHVYFVVVSTTIRVDSQFSSPNCEVELPHEVLPSSFRTFCQSAHPDSNQVPVRHHRDCSNLTTSTQVTGIGNQFLTCCSAIPTTTDSIWCYRPFVKSGCQNFCFFIFMLLDSKQLHFCKMHIICHYYVT
jgi:hypothetical protein